MDGFDLPELELSEEHVVDAPEPEEIETPELEAEPVAEGAETPGGEAEPEEPTDGRKVPDEVRKALKAFRDSSPENAKAARALNDSFGREQAYKQEFPTVQDARAAKATLATIESYGGVEGVQASLQEIQDIDADLKAGNPAAVDKILEFAGEGASKIVPAMLDKFQASNPDAYAAAIKPHLVAAIEHSGLKGAFSEIMRAMEIANTAGAPPEFKAKWEKEATDRLGIIKGWLDKLGEKQAPPAAAGPDPKLAERETAIAAREFEALKGEVSTQANPAINSAMSKAIAPHIKGLNKDQVQDFKTKVYAEVKKLADADKTYQRDKTNLFNAKNKDAKAIARLMSAKFDTEVPKAVAAVAKLKLYGAAPAAAAPKPGAPAAAPKAGGLGTRENPKLVTALPNRTEIDFNKTSEDDLVRGVRVLKSGTVIKFNPR